MRRPAVALALVMLAAPVWSQQVALGGLSGNKALLIIDGAPPAYKYGIVHLYDALQANVLPVAIRGARSALPEGTWLLRRGQHVRIDLVLTLVPVRIAWLMEALADVLGFAVCLIFVSGLIGKIVYLILRA